MNRRGVSLMEMAVVLLLLGLMAGVSGAALWSLRIPSASAEGGLLVAGRGKALLTGVPVLVAERDSAGGGSPTALFLPDGRAIGSGIDPILGVTVRHAR